MNRAWLVAAALLAGSCVGSKRVDLTFHTPRACQPAGEDAGPGDACPLRAVDYLKISLEHSDGTVEFEACKPAPAGLCRLEGLRDFLFIERVAQTDGVELTITGWTDRDCRGALALSCETFGAGVSDLSDVNDVPIWCECPYDVPEE